MSTTMAGSGPPGTAAADSGEAERRSRGRLVLDRSVVEKIAGQAAREVAAAGGQSGGFLGIGSHTDLSARPKVDVDLSGQTAHVSMEVALAYPTSLRSSAERIRAQVIERVAALSGVEVSRVDITVTALHHPGPAREALR